MRHFHNGTHQRKIVIGGHTKQQHELQVRVALLASSGRDISNTQQYMRITTMGEYQRGTSGQHKCNDGTVDNNLLAAIREIMT